MTGVMVITGAARGIGHAVASEAARQGYAVWLWLVFDGASYVTGTTVDARGGR